MMRWLMDEAGCDVNLNQPIFVGRDVCDVDNGGLNALWVCKSSEAMLELLSRGCNPNQSCQTTMNMGRFGTRQRSLMVGDGMSSCTVSGHEKLLIRHGALADKSSFYFPPSSDHPCGLFSVPASGGRRFLQCPLSAALKIGNKKMIELLKMYGAEADSPMDVTTDKEVQTLLQTMAMTITLDILVTMTEEPTTRCTRFIVSICIECECV